MIVRDIHGRINIISRASCASDTSYNEKIYQIYYDYTRIYKSVFEYDLFEYANKNKNKTFNTNVNNNLDEENDNEY